MTETVTIDAESDELAGRIDETRLETQDDPEQPALAGSPFTIAFSEPVDPEAFCDEISTAEDPWRMFGIKNQLADERLDETGDVIASEYWSLAGVLFHVEDGKPVGSSKIDLEITSEWVRVYVKSDCCEERAAEFVRTVDQEYGVDITFVDHEERESA